METPNESKTAQMLSEIAKDHGAAYASIVKWHAQFTALISGLRESCPEEEKQILFLVQHVCKLEGYLLEGLGVEKDNIQHFTEHCGEVLEMAMLETMPTTGGKQ